MNKAFSVVVFFLLSVSQSLYAQNAGYWTIENQINQTVQARSIPTIKAQFYQLRIKDFTKNLQSTVKENRIIIPYPDNSFGEFLINEVPVMAPELAAKYPQIKTYSGRNIKTNEIIRLDITPKGFHGMIFSKKGQVYIDPVTKNDTEQYQVYYRKDLAPTEKAHQFNEEEPIIFDQQRYDAAQRLIETGNVERPSGTQLRTYRIAIAATGEYTQFHGGTVVGALSAMVTTMNRVNGIYERDAAIRMVIIANNDQIIFTNPDTDPFSNNSASAMINEVPTEINTTIGSANYDIGHGFSTGAGGLAGLGVVCTSGKARGVTGTNTPIGDPFDVDYVAHEIGHQFGAPHTFNGNVGSCSGSNRSAGSAYEPGSGSTIMAYAGICGSQNLQNNSDAYFHVASLDAIHAYSQTGNGNSCAEITNTGNSIPIVNAGNGGFTIPISTPFQLNGSAVDPDGDLIEYNWEQFNLGAAGDPNNPSGNAPIFRSYAPQPDSFRIFPQLSDLLNNIQTIGEILPTYSRDLTFRLIARDVRSVAGVQYDQISFQASADAGPFTVNDITGGYNGRDSVDVSWEVANTDGNTINCQLVNIYLSNNGGQSFDYLLLENTPNDGLERVALANINAADARIKVAAADNIFFNITNTSFSIEEFIYPYDYNITFEKEIYCPDETINITIETASIGGYNEQISFDITNLPSGLSSAFNKQSVLPGESLTLTLSNDQKISGEISFRILSSSQEVQFNQDYEFLILNEPVPVVNLIPAPDTDFVNTQPLLQWTDNVNLQPSYDIQIASDPEFQFIVDSALNLDAAQFRTNLELNQNTEYFVRIKAKNNCGESAYVVTNFTTTINSCQEYISTNIPLTIPTNPGTISSSIVISNSGSIESVKVKNIRGTHTYIKDLIFTLESPSGTRVTLLNSICGSEDDFNISFNDFASSDIIPCPPVDGLNYRPAEPLSQLIGEDIRGTWRLYIQDTQSADGGQLENWELEICSSIFSFPPEPPANLEVSYISDGNIELSWEKGSENTLEFGIERAFRTSSTFDELGLVDSSVNVFTDKLPTYSDFYRYQVYAQNEAGRSAGSPIIEASIEILNSGEAEINELTLYPNPAEKKIYVRHNKNLIIEKIMIVNSKGQLINQYKGNLEEIDLNHLNPGLYLFQFQIAGKLLTRHVVIK